MGHSPLERALQLFSSKEEFSPHLCYIRDVIGYTEPGETSVTEMYSLVNALLSIKLC